MLVEQWHQRETRTELRTALTRHTIAAAGGLKRKGGKALTLDDFLPAYYKPKKPKLTPEQETAQLKKAFAEFIIPTPKPNT